MVEAGELILGGDIWAPATAWPCAFAVGAGRANGLSGGCACGIYKIVSDAET
jgi:hypothetical protein